MVNLKLLYDYDKEMLVLPSRYIYDDVNKNSPKYVITKVNGQFKQIIDDAIKRSEPVLSEEQFLELFNGES